MIINESNKQQFSIDTDSVVMPSDKATDEIWGIIKDYWKSNKSYLSAKVFPIKAYTGSLSISVVHGSKTGVEISLRTNGDLITGSGNRLKDFDIASTKLYFIDEEYINDRECRKIIQSLIRRLVKVTKQSLSENRQVNESLTEAGWNVKE